MTARTARLQQRKAFDATLKSVGMTRKARRAALRGKNALHKQRMIARQAGDSSPSVSDAEAELNA